MRVLTQNRLRTELAAGNESTRERSAMSRRALLGVIL